jgi:hypothetical protein
MQLADFHNKHKGQTCLIVGVGPNLHLTPPQWFDYPSFGVNTIYKSALLGLFDGWKPTYYVGVDERLRLEDGAAICEAYPDVPKFFPRPDWDELQGENIYRFKHEQRADFIVGGQLPSDRHALTQHGITYRRIMDAVFQIAWHMGFTTMLMIGVQHKPTDDLRHDDTAHFWGDDTKAVKNQPNTWWFAGYQFFSNIQGLRVLNISEDTHVPEWILPRDDWRRWATKVTA